MSVTFRIRMFFRHQAMAFGHLFPSKSRFHGVSLHDILDDAARLPHPSEDCHCEDRLTAARVSGVDNISSYDTNTGHFRDCEWAKVMCRSCLGMGSCRECGGDGTAPSASPSASPSLSSYSWSVKHCSSCNAELLFSARESDTGLCGPCRRGESSMSRVDLSAPTYPQHTGCPDECQACYLESAVTSPRSQCAACGQLLSHGDHRACLA